MRKLFHALFAMIPFIFIHHQCVAQCSVDAGNDITACVGMEGFSQSLGESLVIEGGTAPYTYAWSASYWIGSFSMTASDLLNDTTLANPELLSPNDDSLAFTISVTDSNGNTCSDELVVYFCNAMWTLEDKQVTITQGDTAQLYPGVYGNCEPITFHWSPEYNISDPNVDTPTVWPDSTTYYTATATDSAGCVIIDSHFAVYVVPLSITELGQSARVSVFPNPMTDFVVFEFSGAAMSGLRVELYDAQGRMVSNTNVSGERLELKRGDLQSGLYIYRIFQGNRGLGEGKIVAE